jgi:hypothetical protein
MGRANEDSTGADGAGTAELRDGRLYLNHATCERWLQDCIAVALLARDDGWWLLPMRGGAGGLQLKQCNARGDHVVEVREFLRQQGVDDDAPARHVVLVFDAARGGFRLEP